MSTDYNDLPEWLKELWELSSPLARKAEQEIAQLEADRRELAISILAMADTLQSTYGRRVFGIDILQKAQQWAKE